MCCSDVYVAQYHCYGGKETIIQTWTFEVTGEQKMDCEGCENAVQRSLTRLPGVRQVQADHHTQRVVVQLDAAQTDAEAIKARLAASGYQAHQLADPTTT
jgi:copper chaperone